MKLATVPTSIGSVITIETDEELDLRSHGVFAHACKLAEHPASRSIEVNLAKTRNIRDSGLAMLLMLCEQTGWESHRVRVVNCSPEVSRRLVASGTVSQLLTVPETA